MATRASHSRPAIAAAIALGATPCLSGCQSLGEWYVEFNDSASDLLHGGSSHGHHGGFISANFQGGGDELLVFAAVYGGILIVAGAIELGEYCYYECRSWFE